MAHRDLKFLEQELGITFHKRQLYKQAFTHSSFVNERRLEKYESNERLEFLGDAVLELTVSDFLYEKFPTYPEGELTKLRASTVCEPALVQFAEKLRFGEYVRLGKGEEMTGGRNRPALLADVFESFIAALYLDQGLEPVAKFLRKHVFSSISDEGKWRVSDYKTRLQEFTQGALKEIPRYTVVDSRGPDHAKVFEVAVFLGDRQVASGEGSSKKEAEQGAARSALAELNDGEN